MGELSNKTIFLLIIVLFLLGILTLVINFWPKKEYDGVKIDSKKEFIYLKNDGYSSVEKKYPYININGNYANSINNEILELEKKYYNSDKSKIGFRFSRYKNILSLVVQVIDNEEQHPIHYFKTYNINLNTQGQYTNDDIYEKFLVTDQKIEDLIKKNYKKKYKEIVEKKYIPKNSCDYNCFLKWCSITDYKSNNLYIENGILYVYKAFDIYSLFKNEQYFTMEDFKIRIK